MQEQGCAKTFTHIQRSINISAASRRSSCIGALAHAMSAAVSLYSLHHFHPFPPPEQKPWDRENSHSVQYVQQLAQLASRNGAAFLDIFSAWQADPDWHNKLLLPDKLHLSPKGNEVLFNAIVSTLERSFPELAPSGQALNWPLMDVISKDDPKAAFSKVVMNPSRVAGSCGGGSTPQWSRGRRM